MTGRGRVGGAEKSAFDDVLSNARRNTAIQRWDQVEPDVVGALSAFDTEYRNGKRTAGWYQRKAGFFNDLLIQLLANATQRDIGRSVKRKSALFDEIDIDLCYPATAAKEPIVGAEAKILGAPPHPGNKNVARSALQDIHKRVREVALTSVDFKVRYARPQPIASFSAWVQETRPKYYSFWAFRVIDDKDFAKLREIMNSLRTYCNGVGAFFYAATTDSAPTTYVAKPASELGIDRVLKEMSFAIAQDE